MNNFWNERFLRENEIWGRKESKTCEPALEYFLRNKANTILIPGVGYGRNANFFLKNGLNIEGIEISDYAIELARKNGLTFQIYKGSAIQMPFNDKKYDGIYCFNTLHLFIEKDRNYFIQKCYNQLVDNGIIFFVVFSENEPSYGKGNQTEENTFESRPGRPVHYFSDNDLRNHFKDFKILDSGLMEDPEEHGEEGAHTHIVRYIVAQKKVQHEFDGKKYRESSRHQNEWGMKIISEFNFNGNESVLDLGCGDGSLTKVISELVPNGKVLGIDASQGMIDAAKEFEAKNLFFQKMDINEINYNNEFDIIFSNATLHWVKDHKKLVENTYKALKNNGIVRYNFAGDGTCVNFYDVIKETMKSSKYKKYFTLFIWPWYMPSIEEYQFIVKQNKFSEIKIWGENADRYFTDSKEMINWIDQPSIVPFLKLIDEKDKENFRNEVIGKMIQKTEQSDGRCFETFRRINVFAVKKE